MGAASIASSGLGIAGSIYQTIEGAKQKRDAQNALENYERQKLTNVADSLDVSTLGADLQRQEQARLASGQIDALQQSGTRGLIGGLGRVQAGNQRVMAQTAADLDMQKMQIEQMQAEDEARIRALQEAREQNDINALSSQFQAGRQDMFGGMGNIISGVGMLGNSFGRMGGGGQGVQMPQVQSVNQIQPQGINTAQTTIQAPMYPTSQFGRFGQGMFAQPNPYVTQTN